MDVKYNEMLESLLQQRRQMQDAGPHGAPIQVTNGDAVRFTAPQGDQMPGFAQLGFQPVAQQPASETEFVDLTGDDAQPERAQPSVVHPNVAHQHQQAPARVLPASFNTNISSSGIIGNYLSSQPPLPVQRPVPVRTGEGGQPQLLSDVHSLLNPYQQQMVMLQNTNALGQPAHDHRPSPSIITSGSQPVAYNGVQPPQQQFYYAQHASPQEYMAYQPPNQPPNVSPYHPLTQQQQQQQMLYQRQMLGNGNQVVMSGHHLPQGAALGARQLPFSIVPGVLGNVAGTSTEIKPQPPVNVNAKAALNAVLAGLQSAGKDDELNPPQGSLTIPLLRHQRLALHWMSNRESGCALPIGGILADDQGLGKTVTTIALILTNPPDRQLGRTQPASGPTTTAAGGAGLSKKRAAGETLRPPSRRPSSKNLSAITESTSEDFDLSDEEDNVLENGGIVKGEDSEGSVIELDLSDGDRQLEAFKDDKERSGLAEGGTLVVCPATVLYQWEQEIRSKTSPTSGTSVYVYHGKAKGVLPETLARFTIILTTFQTLAMEMPAAGKPDRKKAADAAAFSVSAGSLGGASGQEGGKKRKRELADKGGPLYRVMWHRIVLDECQVIKNPRTLAAHAAWCLKARRRWCLSGTPMQNSVDDLYPYFKFLRYEPYSHAATFKQMIRDPIAGHNPEVGYQRLQAVLHTIMLRRTKNSKIDGEPVVSLPERRVRLEQKEFSAEEKEFYEKLRNEADERMKKFQDEGTVRQNYVNILWMLLRLRQACNHPWLVRGSQHSYQRASTMATGEAAAAKRLAANTRDTLTSILTDNLTECVVCNDVPEEPVASICGHVYCRQCVSSLVSMAGHGDAEAELAYHCPACGHTLGRHDTFGLAALTSASKNGEAGPSGTSEQLHASMNTNGSGVAGKGSNGAQANWQSSAKVDALMALLGELRGKSVEAAVEVSRPVVRSVSGAKLAEALARGKGGVRQQVVGKTVPHMEKVIVFSQWTSMLDLVEIPLRKERYEFRRLDGSMSIPNRQLAIRDFSTCPEVTVMLVSLKAASLGVNLVSANHVVLLDLWYNPTVEEQAIDRAHRIGQTRPVHVTRLTIKDSVEDKILDLQDKKRQMIDAAVGEGGEGGKIGTRLTIDDLRYLFGV